MSWIEAHGKGRYRGRYLGPDGQKLTAAGPQGQKSSTSKREVKRWAEEAEARLRSGTWHDERAGRKTFAEYFTEDFLPNRMVELTQHKTYVSHFHSSLDPAFGRMEISKISSPVIQRWVAAEVKAGAHPKTIANKFRTLQTVLAGKKGVSALRDGLIAGNPCEGVTLPHADRRRPHNYTVVEVDRLMDAIGEWWVPLVLLQADTGLRWGELMGLRVSSFDADALSGLPMAWLDVRDTILEVTKADTTNGTPFMWKPRPKGKRPRRIRVSPEVAAVLQELVHKRQLFPHDRLFSRRSPSGLPYRTSAWPEGKPISRRTFLDIWQRAHVASGVPREGRRPHDVRGSHLTWLLQAGVDLVTVMERAGHVHLSTTQGYLDPGRDAELRAQAALSVMRSSQRAGA